MCDSCLLNTNTDKKISPWRLDKYLVKLENIHKNPQLSPILSKHSLGVMESKIIIFTEDTNRGVQNKINNLK